MHKKSIEASEKLHAAELKEEIDDSEFDNEDYHANESKLSSVRNGEIEHCDWSVQKSANKNNNKNLFFSRYDAYVPDDNRR